MKDRDLSTRLASPRVRRRLQVAAAALAVLAAALAAVEGGPILASIVGSLAILLLATLKLGLVAMTTSRASMDAHLANLASIREVQSAMAASASVGAIEQDDEEDTDDDAPEPDWCAHLARIEHLHSEIGRLEALVGHYEPALAELASVRHEVAFLRDEVGRLARADCTRHADPVERTTRRHRRATLMTARNRSTRGHRWTTFAPRRATCRRGV